MARKKKGAGCHRANVRFKTKRGRVIEFPGRVGNGCGPRKKPSTKHLARFKAGLKSAARKCKGKPRKAFLACVSNNIEHILPSRPRTYGR